MRAPRELASRMRPVLLKAEFFFFFLLKSCLSLAPPFLTICPPSRLVGGYSYEWLQCTNRFLNTETNFLLFLYFASPILGCGCTKAGVCRSPCFQVGLTDVTKDWPLLSCIHVHIRVGQCHTSSSYRRRLGGLTAVCSSRRSDVGDETWKLTPPAA